MQYSNLESNIGKVNSNLVWLFLFLLFYISADTSFFKGDATSIYGRILNVFIVSSATITVFVNRHKLPIKFFLPFGIIFFSFIITIIVNRSFSGGYIYLFSLYLIAIFIVGKVSFKDFCTYYEKLVFFFAVCSLLFYVFRLLGFGYSLIDVVHNDVIYHHNILNSHLGSFYTTLRNFSIFREPGVFAIYLNFAILINSLKDNKVFIRLLILYVALITTFSTSGIIVGFLLLLLIFDPKKLNPLVLILLIIGLIFFSIFIGYESIINSEYAMNTFGKLSVSSDTYASTFARTSSIYVPLKIFIENPLGIGFDNFIELYSTTSYELIKESLSTGMSTNTITNMFARFGFIGIFTIIWVYRLANLFSFVGIYKWLIFTIFLLCFFSQDLWNSTVFTTFLIYGMSHGRNK